MPGRAQGNLAGLRAGAGSGSAHWETSPFTLQTTRRCRSSIALVTVQPPASSHWPGLYCSCHSCCCKPRDGVRHSQPKDRNWAQEAGTATLTCPGVPPEAPALGTTPTTRTSCHPAASKRVSIRGFNPKKVSRPGSTIPATTQREGQRSGEVGPLPSLPLSQRNKLCRHGRSERRCGSRAGRSQGDTVDSVLRKMPLPRAGAPGQTDRRKSGKQETVSCLRARGRRGRMLGPTQRLPPVQLPWRGPGQPLRHLPSWGSTAQTGASRGAAPTCLLPVEP